MQQLAIKIIKPFIAALLFLALLFIARQVGYSAGHADANAENQQADIAALNKSIGDLKVATKEAGAVNLALHKTISARQQADQQSTKVFINALSKTAHLRADCNFDDGVMQGLYKAAAAATQAASSGFGNAVPTSHPPNR